VSLNEGVVEYMNINGKRFDIVLDNLQVIFSLISIVILTLFFRMYTTSIRYLFLLLNFFVIISLSRTLKRVNTSKQEERVIRYSKGKIEPKFIKKVRL
jgi:hypothetical protein